MSAPGIWENLLEQQVQGGLQSEAHMLKIEVTRLGMKEESTIPDGQDQRWPKQMWTQGHIHKDVFQDVREHAVKYRNKKSY